MKYCMKWCTVVEKNEQKTRASPRKTVGSRRFGLNGLCIDAPSMKHAGDILCMHFGLDFPLHHIEFRNESA